MEVEKLRSNKYLTHFLRELKRLDAYNQFIKSSKFYKDPIAFEENIISIIPTGNINFLSPKFIIDWSNTKEGYYFWYNISRQIKFNKN